VAEGRRVLGNIERVASLFLTKTVYAVLLAMATAGWWGSRPPSGLEGLRFPFLPRHLTLISTLTIGVPAFILALAPSTQRVEPGFVTRVLRFAVPAGIAAAAATFSSYIIGPAHPGQHRGRRPHHGGDHPGCGGPSGCSPLIARPYTWWRLALIAAMAAGFVLVLAVPWTRTFFQPAALQPGD